MSTTTTLSLIRSNPTYFVPARVKASFMSLDTLDTYFTFNGFLSPDNPINVIYADGERAAGETGQFSIIVEDSNGEINKDHLRNCVVRMSFGKTEVTLLPWMVGYADIFEIREPRSYYMEYLLSGPSSKIRAAELMLLVRKSTSKINDKDFGIGNLVQDMIKTRTARPLNDKDIKTIWGLTAELVTHGGGIQDSLNEIYFPVVSEVFSTLWDFIERMAAASGANWDIDYMPGNFAEMLVMKHPSAMHSTVRVKSISLATALDDPLNTSYIKNGFTISENSTSDAGTATRAYTATNVDRKRIGGLSINQNFLDLSNKAIAQQFIIQNDERRITDLDFILSRIGEPEVSTNVVHGDMCFDSGDNKPTGLVFATFQIPLDTIQTTADTIFVNGLDTDIGFLPGATKVWVRIFQRSGFDGTPNTNILNAVRWHNNNVFNTTQEVYTATAPVGEYSNKSTLAWSSANVGPIFACGIYSKINRLQARTNQSAAKILRLKEKFFDTSFMGADFQSINRILALTLARVSKTRRSVSSLDCTLPNNFLFKPYQVVSFEDPYSNTFQDLEIQRARIVVSATPGEDSVLGALSQEITISGAFNRLIGDCSCS